MLDPEQATTAELAATYHHRWEIETSFAEIETRQRSSYRVLRSHSPEMVRQEIWGMLTTHYAIRELMYHAADHDEGDQLRLSFIRTLGIVRRNSPGKRVFTPDRLAISTATAVAEITNDRTPSGATARLEHYIGIVFAWWCHELISVACGQTLECAHQVSGTPIYVSRIDVQCKVGEPGQ
ncbi:transposase [Nocardia fluminea]|uniref:transposase n=1 Tax=Nocardia fluminea TaxID=134984 RepID=UPI003D12DFEA